MEMPVEKGQLGPQPSKRHLQKDGAGGTGGDAASTSSHTSRVSFSSRLQVQLSQSSAPAARGDKPPRHSRQPQSSRSRPSSARAGRGQRSAVSSPVPANAAARGQCRRLRSCVACSGKATPDTASTVPSTPSTPALTEIEALLVHESTQTEPGPWAAAERVDREAQTESPGRERRAAPVRLFAERHTQTLPPALPPRAAAGLPGPPRRPPRLSRLRRLLRACRGSCTAAQPPPLGAGPGAKAAQHASAAAGIGVLMVIQESAEGTEWSPYSSWPWLAETSL